MALPNPKRRLFVFFKQKEQFYCFFYNHQKKYHPCCVRWTEPVFHDAVHLRLNTVSVQKAYQPWIGCLGAWGSNSATSLSIFLYFLQFSPTVFLKASDINFPLSQRSALTPPTSCHPQVPIWFWLSTPLRPRPLRPGKRRWWDPWTFDLVPAVRDMQVVDYLISLLWVAACFLMGRHPVGKKSFHFVFFEHYINQSPLIGDSGHGWAFFFPASDSPGWTEIFWCKAPETLERGVKKWKKGAVLRFWGVVGFFWFSPNVMI